MCTHSLHYIHYLCVFSCLFSYFYSFKCVTMVPSDNIPNDCLAIECVPWSSCLLHSVCVRVCVLEQFDYYSFRIYIFFNLSINWICTRSTIVRMSCQCDVMMITSGAEFRISSMMQDSSIFLGGTLKFRMLFDDDDDGGGGGWWCSTVSPLLLFRYS